ncbi:MAG TPA: non-canonical purine NTP pyrophosphatase, partial [Gammaproteobacteria bacterium]|nr:non-canonical purine NTP pyrophosphatase [Gammaproteobacteria bacterium]
HYKDPTPIICQAQWDGLLLDHPQGEGGFGYDPIFYIPTLNCTVAQLSNAEKNKISHRGKALRELVNQLKGIYKPKGEFLHTKNIFEQHGS